TSDLPSELHHSIIPKSSSVGGHSLPIEIWDQIVSYITNPAALYSLLPTCKRISHVVLRRLYAHPLESMGWHYHHPLKAFERFVTMVLTFSTLDNEDTAFLREKLGITSFGHQQPYTNYIGLIQQWDLDFARFVYLLKIIDSSAQSFLPKQPPTSNPDGFEWSAHVQRVHGALFWGMFEMHSMEHIRRIEVDYPDLDRLAARVDELRCLERLSICDMSDNGSRTVVPGVNEQTDEELDRRFKAIANFVELYIKRHGNTRLREIELNRAGLGRKLQEAKLAIFAHLTPLKHLKELNLNNWHRLMARVDETDLSHVRSIELQASDPTMMVEWTCPPKSVLQRCRELEHLVMDANDQDIFAWAVDELHEAKRLKHHPTIQPPTPLPLKSLAISAKDIHFPQVVHDAVVAFGQTLTSLTSETIYEDPSAPEASELVAIDCGSLPSLRFLKMFIVDTLVLDTSFLSRAPRLQIMSLGDNVSWYWPSNYEYHPQWDLPRLKFLRLDGLMASMFDPRSLRNMPFLVGIALKGPYQGVEHDLELRRDFFRYDPEDDETPGRCFLPMPEEETGLLHNAGAWSWQWYMPQLSMIELKGEPAFRFHFRCLRWCPVLTELKLHIDHQRRPLRLCEDLDEDNEEEVRAARKAMKREMGEAAVAKGEEVVPTPSKPKDTLLDWYEVDLFEYAMPDSTKAEDEERAWDWKVAAPRLQTLTITGSWSVSTDDVKRMLDPEVFPKLEELKLYRCKHYDTEALCRAAAGHRRLRELVISRQWTRKDQHRMNVMPVDPPKKWRQVRGANFLYGDHGGPMWEQRFWTRAFGIAGENFVKVKAKGRNFMLPKVGRWSNYMRVFLSTYKPTSKRGDEGENDSARDEKGKAVDENSSKDGADTSTLAEKSNTMAIEARLLAAAIGASFLLPQEDQEATRGDGDESGDIGGAASSISIPADSSNDVEERSDEEDGGSQHDPEEHTSVVDDAQCTVEEKRGEEGDEDRDGDGDDGGGGGPLLAPEEYPPIVADTRSNDSLPDHEEHTSTDGNQGNTDQEIEERDNIEHSSHLAPSSLSSGPS
ncbi:hypothetical protein BGW41_005028, partial [Actinomortierella wolfii]